MAGFFERVFRLSQAEAHAAIDKLEDPVKMTEQAIRELKKDLEQSLQNFAEVKSIAIKSQRDMEKSRSESEDWERKAMALLQQGQSGRLPQQEADRLATEALSRKDESAKRYITSKQAYDGQNQTVQTLQQKIEKMKSMVAQYENELVTLKARAKTAEATSKINKQLSSVDSSGTVALLERMKQKVEDQENLAQAYGEMASTGTSVEDEINQALLESQTTSNNQALDELKSRMGLLEGETPSTTNDRLEALKAKMAEK